MFGIFILHHYVSVRTVIVAKSFTKGWIQAQRSANKGADPGLIERHSNHQTGGMLTDKAIQCPRSCNEGIFLCILPSLKT